MALGQGPTGLLADITASPGGLAGINTWKLVSIGPLVVSNTLLDDTHLLTTDFTSFIAAPLQVIDPIEASVQWDYTIDMVTLDNDSNLLDITLPKHDLTAAGTLTGSAVVQQWSLPIGTPSDRSIGTITYQYDNNGTVLSMTQATA